MTKLDQMFDAQPQGLTRAGQSTKIGTVTKLPASLFHVQTSVHACVCQTLPSLFPAQNRTVFTFLFMFFFVFVSTSFCERVERHLQDSVLLQQHLVSEAGSRRHGIRDQVLPSRTRRGVERRVAFVWIVRMDSKA